VKPFSEEIERGRNQAQDAREHERRAHRFTGRQPNNQDEGRNSEAAAANAVRPTATAMRNPRKKLICRLSPKKCECRIRASFRPIARISDC